MSARLQHGSHTFPTSGENGLIKIHLGSHEVTFEIPYKEDFEYDCETSIHPDIMCYLENSEHIIVIRFDGSLTRYNKARVPIGNIKIDISQIMNGIEFLRKGSIIQTNDGRVYLNGLYWLKDKKVFILFNDLYKGHWEIPRMFNRDFVQFLQEPLVFLPRIYVDENAELSIRNEAPMNIPLVSKYIHFQDVRSIY